MNYKQQAARKALEYVQNGMILGLGSGSTTALFVDALGEGWQAGVYQNLQAVPTSLATAKQAQLYGIPLTTLAEHAQLDLAVDGADEVDPSLNLIKGLGLALLREKIVEIHARQFIVIVDESKLVGQLGTRCPVPVEVLPFEWQAHLRWLGSLGCRVELRRNQDGTPTTTDNGNYIALCWFTHAGGIGDPYNLARQLANWPGVIEHGLFLDMANQVIVAGANGVQVIQRPALTNRGLR